jgi:hypothetical protein
MANSKAVPRLIDRKVANVIVATYDPALMVARRLAAPRLRGFPWERPVMEAFACNWRLARDLGTVRVFGNPFHLKRPR